MKVDLGQVRDQRAYLVRITTRQSLDRLRTLRRRKEAYVGPWLPEPLLTAPDVAEDVELAESVSMAMMLVLETLSPTERAVFVLREAFDVGYDEIAAAVDKTPAAVRQIAHRARQHVDARRPREVVSPTEARATLEAFRDALEAGDPQRLLDVLAPDVVLVSDGGGVKRAALRPIVGADKLVRYVLGGIGKAQVTLTTDPTVVNGNPALVLRVDGETDGVMAVRVEDAQHHRSLLRPQPAQADPHRLRDRARPAVSTGDPRVPREAAALHLPRQEGVTRPAHLATVAGPPPPTDGSPATLRVRAARASTMQTSASGLVSCGLEQDAGAAPAAA